MPCIRGVTSTKERGERHLAEVKAQGRRRIEIPIDVMHEVESPQRRPFVTGPMPPPERVVEKKNRRQRVRPGPKSKTPQKAPGRG
jgi:hypothetical protein